MQQIPLYRYIRPDGGVTVSTMQPGGDYIPMTRLAAEEGYTLTNGKTITGCTDTVTPEDWREIPDPALEKTCDPFVMALSEVSEDDH